MIISTILIRSIRERGNGMSFHFLVPFCIFSFRDLKFSLPRSFTSWLNLFLDILFSLSLSWMGVCLWSLPLYAWRLKAMRAGVWLFQGTGWGWLHLGSWGGGMEGRIRQSHPARPWLRMCRFWLDLGMTFIIFVILTSNIIWLNFHVITHKLK